MTFKVGDKVVRNTAPYNIFGEVRAVYGDSRPRYNLNWLRIQFKDGTQSEEVETNFISLEELMSMPSPPYPVNHMKQWSRIEDEKLLRMVRRHNSLERTKLKAPVKTRKRK